MKGGTMGQYEAGMEYAERRLRFSIERLWLEIVVNQFQNQKQATITYSDEVKRKLGIDA
jgi:hypothetical protein